MAFSLRKLLGPTRPPLTLEQVADFWTNKNVSAFAAVAMRSMMDPVGTAYDVPPLRIVVFPTADARILYQLRLHEAARAQRKKPVVQHAIGQHIEELVLFGREQFIAALSQLDIRATFQTEDHVGTR